jgi:hypothetical protein
LVNENNGRADEGVLDFLMVSLGLRMEDIYELLREKELEISRLKIEVDALRIVALLLSDNEESGHDSKPTSIRRAAPSVRQVPQELNANPQPTRSGFG